MKSGINEKKKSMKKKVKMSGVLQCLVLPWSLIMWELWYAVCQLEGGRPPWHSLKGVLWNATGLLQT